MSVVIPFALRPKIATAQDSPSAPREAAEILFFTGVRYERQLDPVPVEALRRRRRRAVARGKSAGQPA
jgi:hypothetical protein